MCRPAVLWGGVLAAGIAIEAHAIHAGHHDCTLSAMTRRVWHTQHPAGRAAFVIGVYAVAAWFVHHIINRKD